MGSYDSPRIGSLQWRFRRGVIVCVALLFLSLLLQIAGFVTPGWIVIKFLVKDISIGLWYSKYCVFDNCEMKSYNDPDIVSNIFEVVMIEFQIETTSSLLCIIIAIVIACIFGRKPRRIGILKFITFFVFILPFISGILALIACVKILGATIWADEKLQNQSHYKSPYSLIVSGVGGIIACINAIIFLAIVRPCVSDTHSNTTNLQSYPNTRDGYPDQPMYGEKQPYRSSDNNQLSCYTGPYVIPDQQAHLSEEFASMNTQTAPVHQY